MRTAIALSIVGMVLAATAAAGMMEPDHTISVDANGVILNGYDAVAYFTDHKAVEGKADITAVHDGAIYRFASKKHRDLFTADPHKYAPQFGGWCAYGVAVNKKFPVDGQAFEVRDGKLYLNLDKKIQKKWAEDPAKFARDAHANWAKIEMKAAKEL